MDTNDYLPRVLEDDRQPESTVSSDPSKWTAVHDTLDNTTSKRHASSLFTVAWVLGLTLGLVWVWRNGKTVFGQWKENVHRRANRRLHGIPDDDDRPFNVAYAAAALSRKQRKGKREKPHTLPRESSKLDRPEESAGLRQRPLHAEFAPSSSSQHASPMIFQTQADEYVPRASAQPVSQLPSVHDWSGPYDGSRPGQTGVPPHPQGLHSNSSGANLNGRKQSERNEEDRSHPERRKHHDMNDDDDDDDEFRMSKKSRMDEEEYIDGDTDAPWIPGGLRRSSLQVPKRGAKRHVTLADEGDWEMSQDKRARKGSLAVPDPDVLEIDEVMMDTEPSDEVHSTNRGTKREREELDDVAENSDELHRSQPSRKRRDDGRGRTTETAARSRKRDRSSEKLASGEEEGDERDTQTMRRKRGRPHAEPEQDEDTEMVALDALESEDIPSVIEDPACGGRRIGEVWEVNGQSFKVGLDGRRLRHALVKQQRTKFPMPRDSSHNDARTHVDVVVEKWLNDEEYKQAKDRFELAWQDSSPTTTPVTAEGTLDDDLAGKRLLWKGPAHSPVKGRASIGPSSSSRNPFELAPSNSSRRVTSAHVILNTPGESPKLRTSNSFSKWEKQDMEANSLKRMRARLEKEKKEKEKEEKQNKEAEKAKFSLPSVPTSTPLAPTTNKPVPETKSTPALATASPAAQATKTATPASPSPFATPTSSIPAGSIPNFFAKPSTTPTPAPAATTQPSATSSPFPTTSTSQNTISFTGTSAPTAAKPSFSFGPPTTTTAPATFASSEGNKGSTPAKPTFTFGSPAPAASTSTPAAFTTLATPGAAKPSFSFGTPSSQTTTSATTNDVSKDPPAFGFATPPANATMSSEQGKASIPANPFAAKPVTQPSSTTSFTPTGNLSSPFTFNQSSSQSQQQTTQNKPAFQFGASSIPNNTQNTSGTTPSGTGASSSGSLLNRLGPAPTSSQEPSQQSTTAPSQKAWSSPFGGGTTLSTPSMNILGETQLQQGSLNASPNKPSPFSPSQPEKTVFGQPSLMGSQSAFSFGKTSAGASDPSKTAATRSPFALASQSGSPSSVFGQPSGQSGAPASQPSTSVFGQVSGQPGTTSASQPVFGQPSGQSGAVVSQQAGSSIFGKPSGQFGASASKQTGSSVFGQPGGQSGASMLPQAGSSVFGKPSGQPDASASQPKASFSFNVGGSSNSSTSASLPNANPFQPAQTPATTSQTNQAAPNNFFVFGQSSSNTSNTTPSASAFGFNKPTDGETK